MIDNPEAVRFANEKVRPVADRYAQLYWAAKILLTEWDASNIGALIPNTSEVIDDGSAEDGRTPITGAMVNGLKANLALLVGDLENNGGAKLAGLSIIAVNERPR